MYADERFSSVELFRSRPLDVPPRREWRRSATRRCRRARCRRGFDCQASRRCRGSPLTSASRRMGPRWTACQLATRRFSSAARSLPRPPARRPSQSPPCAGTQTDRQTHTWLQVKHAPKLGTYRLDHMSVSQEHAPPAGEAEALIGSACSYNRAPTLVLEAHWALGDSALPAGESRPKGVQPPPTSIAASR